MATKTTSENAAPEKPLTAASVVQNVCGVGCAVAERLAAQLSAAQQAAIVNRYKQPDAHDEIRQLVLAPQGKPADEPSGDRNDA